MPESKTYLLQDLLREVSRSFYLTLRVLPRSIRSQIGTAYLLARASDTIADTDALPVEERLGALGRFQEQLEAAEPVLSLNALGARQTTEGERMLLERIDDVLRLLRSFDPADQKLILNVLRVITDGQKLDLVRFGNASEERIAALRTDAELDEYTFRVAGCVGEFWTRMCVFHLLPKPKSDTDALVQKGICFGKGLQLVNILRDIPKDLRQGRCYLPEGALRQHSLIPADLLKAANEAKLRPLYDLWLNKAEEHLGEGWEYVLDLPRSWIRVRLACAWPILIGYKTIEKLRTGTVLNPDTRIKVSRQEVKRILRQTVVRYPVAAWWRRLPKDV